MSVTLTAAEIRSLESAYEPKALAGTLPRHPSMSRAACRRPGVRCHASFRQASLNLIVETERVRAFDGCGKADANQGDRSQHADSIWFSGRGRAAPGAGRLRLARLGLDVSFRAMRIVIDDGAVVPGIRWHELRNRGCGTEVRCDAMKVELASIDGLSRIRWPPAGDIPSSRLPIYLSVNTVPERFPRRSMRKDRRRSRQEGVSTRWQGVLSGAVRACRGTSRRGPCLPCRCAP